MKIVFVVILNLVISFVSVYSNENGIIIPNNIKNNHIFKNIDLRIARENFRWPSDEEVQKYPKVTNRRDTLDVSSKLRSKVLSPKWVKHNCFNWLKYYILKEKWLSNDLKNKFILQQMNPSGESRVLLKYKKNGFSIQVIFKLYTIFIVIDPPSEFVDGLVNEEICHKVFQEIFIFGNQVNKFKVVNNKLFKDDLKVFYLKETPGSTLSYYASRYWFLQNKKVGIYLRTCDPFISSYAIEPGDPWF